MEEISDHHRSLFLGKISDTLTPEEAGELDNLLATNEHAKAYYEELLSTLPADDVANAYSRLNAPGYWKDISADLRKKAKRVHLMRTFSRLAAAALIAGVIAGGWILWQSLNSASEQPKMAIARQNSVLLKLANGQTLDLTAKKGEIVAGDMAIQNEDNSLTYSAAGETIGINTITVPTGMDYKIKLSDGSQVWLNSATKLDFPSRFAGGNREIVIAGEAYLEVAKNAASPFIVQLPAGRVEVTGTSFNINTYDKRITTVSLIEGGLNISAGNAALTIIPGREALITQGSLTERAFNTKTTASWRKGLFYFEEATLDDIAPVLERWFGVHSRTDRPELRERQFGGVLDKNEPLEVFLENLKRISKIEARFDDNGILHFR